MLWWFACGAPELKFVEQPVDGLDAELPLIVALHGYGDVPESALEMVASCKLDGVRIVAPRGPKKHPSGQGAAWYPVNFGADGVERDPGDPLNSADQVERFIRSYEARRPTKKVIVTGFSQGGILSFALATRYPKLIDAAIPVSGMAPEVVPPKAGAPPIRALHGADDRLLPAQDTVNEVAALKEAGWDATIEVFPGVAHGISPGVHEALCRELRAAAAAP